MRIALQEIDKIFREIEASHNLRTGILSEIYRAEARVVFLGKRRNIQPELRKIVLTAIEEREKR